MVRENKRDNNKAIVERAVMNGKSIVPSGTISGTINTDETDIRPIEQVRRCVNSFGNYR